MTAAVAERIPFVNFGANDIAVYDRNALCVAHCRIIGDVDGDFTFSTAELEGGSRNFPYAIMRSGCKGSLKAKVREHNPALKSIALGGVHTEYTAKPTTGDVIDLVNVGTGTLKASAGISTITATADDVVNLKPGLYFLVMKTTTTAEIFAGTDEFIRDGDDVTFQDANKITDTPFTITQTALATTEIEELGLTITRGAAAASMVAATAVRFFVLPGYTYASEVKFGQAVPSDDDYLVVVSGERAAHDGVIDFVMAIFYSCKVYGGNMKFARKGYPEDEVTITPQYSTTENAVGIIKTIRT